MANDSHLFHTATELETEGYSLFGNRFIRGKEVWLPLYEGKMMHQFDHRFASFDDERSHMLPQVLLEQHQAPDYFVLPYYYVPESEVEVRLRNKWNKHWLLGFRDVTSKSLERTGTFSVLPRVGVGHTMPLILTGRTETSQLSCFLADLNSFIFDYNVRQKIGGAHLTYSYLKQLPVLPPDHYTPADLEFIVPRVLELVYTAWDIKPFADDLWREADAPLRAVIKSQWEANAATTGGHVGAQPPSWVELAPDGFARPPFKWDEDRRALLRAELDAYYAHLYHLTHEELRYILDPADVYGPDFPGETFRVLKEKEIRQFGEYRTRRLVLEAWEGLGF